MTLQDAYNDFIYHKKLAGLSPATIEDYYYHLKGFFNFVGLTLPIEALEESFVNDYIMSLHTGVLSRNSVCTYIRNVRIFLTYVADNWGLSFQPAKIKIPKAPKKKIYIYSNAEIVELFHAVSASSDWIVTRNRAILALMLDSGLREKEVVTLLVQDISFESKRLKVHGKGDKERFVPLGNLSARYLHEYMSACPYQGKPYAFYSDDGSQLTCNAVRMFVSHLKKALNFPVFPHNLRHNFATNYCMDKLRKGQSADGYSLKRLMGHSSINTTERYLHLAAELFAVESSSSHLDTIPGLP